MPIIARIAAVVAFIIVGIAVIHALSGQVIDLPLALVPLFAGIGIVRARARSAYGYALYQFVQLLFLPMFLLRSEGLTAGFPRIIALAAVLGSLGVLFLFAGRSLAVAGLERGWAWPWTAVSALATIPVFFVQAFVVPTPTMENTILVGDHLLVQTFPKPSPQRGDIIVFRYPMDASQSFVKRCIGLPGDHIKVVDKDLYLNGKKLAEPYVQHIFPHIEPYRDNFPAEPYGPVYDRARKMLAENVVNGEVVVPEGNYFAMGDNRDNSLDSRYWGFVPRENIIGKPFLIYESEDQEESGKPNWRGRVRWRRYFQLL